MSAVLPEGGRPNAAGPCAHEKARLAATRALDLRTLTTAALAREAFYARATEAKELRLLRDDCNQIARQSQTAEDEQVPLAARLGDAGRSIVFDRRTRSTLGTWAYVKYNDSSKVRPRRTAEQRQFVRKVRDVWGGLGEENTGLCTGNRIARARAFRSLLPEKRAVLKTL